MVGIIALLAGNLIAKGQLAELLSFIVFFLAVGVLQWPLAAKSAAGLLVCYFLSSLHDGVSLEWVVPGRDLGYCWDGGFLLPSYTILHLFVTFVTCLCTLRHEFELENGRKRCENDVMLEHFPVFSVETSTEIGRSRCSW